jgi:hypothetical protein
MVSRFFFSDLIYSQLNCLAIESGRDLKEIVGIGESESVDFGFCAICLEKIVLQETALVKGCEHAYWFVFDIFFIYLSSFR